MRLQLQHAGRSSSASPPRRWRADSCRFVLLFSLIFASLDARAAPRSYDAERLRQEGYVDEGQASTIGTFSHTLTALGPGALIHGLGHWRMGDEAGGWALFGAEVAGLTALLSVGVIQAFRDPSSEESALGVSALSHLGWGLTIGSWVLDVIGAYQGGLTFIQERAPSRLDHISLGYRYLDDESASLTHHIIARHTLKRRRLRLSTELDLESKGELIGLRQDLSVRLTPRAERQGFELQLGVKGRRWQWLESDATQLSLIPYLSWKLPLKGVARGLNHTLIYQRLGYGWEGYQSPRAEMIEAQRDPSTLSISDQLTASVHHGRGVLLIETGLRIKLFQDASLSISYLQDPTIDVQHRSWGASIWGLDRLGLISNEGLWRSELVIRQSPLIDLVVEALIGESWSTWLTVRYSLGRRGA